MTAAHRGLAGRVLLEGVVGSTAYGLATADSDIDSLGVYAAPTSAVLGLDGPAAVSASHVTTRPDTTLHEIGKYAKLALACNPTVLELLWLPGHTVRTDAGGELVALRGAFLSGPAIRSSYTGYAAGQARRLLSKQRRATAGTGAPGQDAAPDQDAAPRAVAARTAKHGRHCLRLLRQARALLGGDPLPVDVSAAREELFAAGELAATDPAAFQALFEREQAALDAVPSVLPDRPDRERVDAYLVALRSRELDRERGDR